MHRFSSIKTTPPINPDYIPEIYRLYPGTISRSYLNEPVRPPGPGGIVYIDIHRSPGCTAIDHTGLHPGDLRFYPGTIPQGKLKRTGPATQGATKRYRYPSMTTPPITTGLHPGDLRFYPGTIPQGKLKRTGPATQGATKRYRFTSMTTPPITPDTS